MNYNFFALNGMTQSEFVFSVWSISWFFYNCSHLTALLADLRGVWLSWEKGNRFCHLLSRFFKSVFCLLHVWTFLFIHTLKWLNFLTSKNVVFQIHEIFFMSDVSLIFNMSLWLSLTFLLLVSCGNAWCLCLMSETLVNV